MNDLTDFVDSTSDELMVDIRVGNFDKVKQYFINHTNLINDIHKGSSSYTALTFAISCTNFNICKLLIETFNADINQRDGNKSAPFHYAIAMGNKDIINLLTTNNNLDITNRASDKESFLIVAASNNRIDIINMLLQNTQIDINQPSTRFLVTPLLIVSVHGFVELAKLLLNKGANVNIKSLDNKRAIDYARKFGHIEIVNLLQEYDDSNSNNPNTPNNSIINNNNNPSQLQLPFIQLKTETENQYIFDIFTGNFNWKQLYLTVQQDQNTITLSMPNNLNNNYAPFVIHLPSDCDYNKAGVKHIKANQFLIKIGKKPSTTVIDETKQEKTVLDILNKYYSEYPELTKAPHLLGKIMRETGLKAAEVLNWFDNKNNNNSNNTNNNTSTKRRMIDNNSNNPIIIDDDDYDDNNNNPIIINEDDNNDANNNNKIQPLKKQKIVNFNKKLNEIYNNKLDSVEYKEYINHNKSIYANPYTNPNLNPKVKANINNLNINNRIINKFTLLLSKHNEKDLILVYDVGKFNLYDLDIKTHPQDNIITIDVKDKINNPNIEPEAVNVLEYDINQVRGKIINEQLIITVNKSNPNSNSATKSNNATKNNNGDLDLEIEFYNDNNDNTVLYEYLNKLCLSDGLAQLKDIHSVYSDNIGILFWKLLLYYTDDNDLQLLLVKIIYTSETNNNCLENRIFDHYIYNKVLPNLQMSSRGLLDIIQPWLNYYTDIL